MSRDTQLLAMYHTMLKALGPSFWWPGDSKLEIMLGAVLTQNTVWSNVEKALANLKENDLIHFQKLLALDREELALLIRPSGFFNVKAKRIHNLLTWLEALCQGDLNALDGYSTDFLREELLAIKGIGPETADSILLYALGRPVFVVDEYTRRIFIRHGLIHEDIDYHELQAFFMDVLPSDTDLYNEYHALIVRVGKNWCKRNKPDCKACPWHEYLDNEFYAE